MTISERLRCPREDTVECRMRMDADRQEAADTIDALVEALGKADETIRALADQQAMPDDFWKATLWDINAALARVKGGEK